MYQIESIAKKFQIRLLPRWTFLSRSTPLLLGIAILTFGPAATADSTPDTSHPLSVAFEANGSMPTRFLLTSGETVIGRFIRLDSETVTIRRPAGRIQVLAIADIESVDIKTAHGELIRSPLKVLAESSDAVESGDLVARQEQDLPIPSAATEKSESGGPLIKLTTDLADEPGVSGIDLREKVAVIVEADDQAGQAEPDVGGIVAPGPVRLTLNATAADESDAAMLFNFELSEPSETSIAIIYTLLDGTAKASEDYTHRQGVVVFKSGQVRAKVAAEIIDDKEAETNETFQLFVTGDPKVVMIENRKIEATIRDNDE